MDETGMLKKAVKIAEKAHEGQVDKGGSPYIFHPLRVMKHGKTQLEKICGVLHDVIEDTDVTLEILRMEGFSEDILEVLDLLTRKENETYNAFIDRISRDPRACRVKLLDLEDNMDMSRIQNPQKSDLKRMEKYRRAYEKLIKVLEL